MGYDDLDGILSEKHEIVPSSGFVASVMEAVHGEAATPPLPFPWKYALPGFIALAMAFASIPVLALTRLVQTTAVQQPSLLPVELAPLLEVSRAVGAGWILLALLLTLASVTLSMHLAGPRN